MKSINQLAPVKCTQSIIIKAKPEQVWKVLTNIDNWSNWQSEIGMSSLNGELKSGSTFIWKTGGILINSKLHTVNPYSEFGWTGKTFGMFAIHNWVLTEHENNTIVKVEESMEGLLAKILKSSFNKSLEKGMAFWLEKLKKEVEKGV
jgi:hypothetical protein